MTFWEYIKSCWKDGPPWYQVQIKANKIWFQYLAILIDKETKVSDEKLPWEWYETFGDPSYGCMVQFPAVVGKYVFMNYEQALALYQGAKILLTEWEKYSENYDMKLGEAVALLRKGIGEK